MYQHYLITRFNLKKEGWSTSKNNIPVLTEEWLERRFNLFENFCFPSIKSQNNQNFIWLVYFDEDTPQVFKDRILGLSMGYPKFQPRYVNNMQAFVPSIQKELQKSKSQYIISTRIDNDDCISYNFIKDIQDRFIETKHQALDYADGYTLQISPDFKLGKKRQLWNPFISLIEENNQPQSVWQKSHADWKLDPLVKRINNKRLWMSIIHQENKVNEFTGYGNVASNQLLNFKINDQKREEITNKLASKSNWIFLNISNYFGTHLKCIFKDIKRSIRLRK
ncbi:glycosyltransferase [Mesonia aestuariivivens]|uniref:Rhamnosyl transferase n=1 Tax=Mesonia aestuariivivens TaxID=2796128 RepID=A0ABS6W0K8_9FLAO|nr:glycosyltransferase [Mesonia aestuariivivens]MBW2961383.1 putative rhamnosyl transferase [Mesonia aestuariivivens]